MSSSFPTALDLFTTAHVGDGTEIIRASTINDLADATNKLERAVGKVFSVLGYGATGDGTTDDTTAIQNAATAAAGGVLYLPPTSAYYKVTSPITIPDNTVVVGRWGGGFWQTAQTKIVKTNGDTNGTSVFTVGANCLIHGISFAGPDQVYYLSAAYPAGTNNPSYGIVAAVTTNNSTRIEYCSFDYFKAAGIGAPTGFQFNVITVFACVFRTNLFGIDWNAFDTIVTNCIFQHNVHSGLRTSNNYTQLLGNRFEWNKRYGAQLGSDANVGGGTVVAVGNLFDRNGWSGIRFMNWYWTLTGNFFRRNGAGGDGTKGILEGIVPASTVPASYPGVGVTPIYLAPAAEYDKSHVQAYGGSYGVATGNVFEYDGDDSGGGSLAPKYVWTAFGADHVRVDRANQDTNGWNVAYRDGAGARTFIDAGTATVHLGVFEAVTALTYSATIATDAYAGNVFPIVATNGTAFTISNPTNPTKAQRVTYDIKNSSGGAMGAITWGAAFLLAGAFTNPANTKRRTISFYYDGTSWVETNRAAADI